MRCPRHDLAMASDGKCVRCHREEEAARAAGPAAPGSSLRVPKLGGLVVAAFVVAWLMVWALRLGRNPPRLPVAGPSAAVTNAAAPSAPPLAPLDPATVAPDPTPRPAASSAPSSLERAMHLAQITLYSRPNSPECGLARAWLLARGYTFKEHDIDADGDARAAWTKASPGGIVPAFDVDGQAFGGFDPARVQAAIEYAGARRLQRR